jgi:UDP-GlcNAc:undecaprenyl-phosphate/decaprenyl-phosphate GlcNAc-1-phosphate transferase
LRANFSQVYGTGMYWVIAFASFFFATFVFSLLINGLFLRFSKTLGIRNHPNGIRWNASNKPAFGGISFYIIFLISTAALSFIFKQHSHFNNMQFLGIHAAVTMGFLMGLFDDSYNTNVLIKLFTQIGCAVVLIATGTSIQISGQPWFDYLITIIWVVGLMNSINMIDNMDGIAGIVSLFIFLAVLIMLVTGNNTASPFTIIHIGMIAALLGFLFFNWHPSKMFMGDTGSQFLGILLAITGILFLWNMQSFNGQEYPAKRLVITVMMFVIPLSDSITVVINRIRRGKSPFVGGKDHTTHHLSYLGLSDRSVALVFTGLSLVNAAMVLFACFSSMWTVVHTILFTLYILIIFSFLFTIGSIRKKQAIT